jgi:phage-related protein
MGLLRGAQGGLKAVLTEVKAYSSWRSAPTLQLDEDGRTETDLIQIHNINGLDPVKASVTTSPYGSVDGTSFTGSNVQNRNIVLTLKPNPNWDTWTYAKLRQLLYSYFMPKLVIRLVFYSDDMNPVEIYGVVEGIENDMFTKEQTFQVSIICPDPYFTSLNPIVLTGQNDEVKTFDYNGNVETGMVVKVTHLSGAPTTIGIQLGDPKDTFFGVTTEVNSSKYFELSSIPMQKYVQNVNIGTGVIDNLLSNIYAQEGSLWPFLQPGTNEFKVVTDDGVQDYQLIFYERFGGL